MKIVALIMCFSFLVLPASALEIEAPTVPDFGREWMPENNASFAEGLFELLRKVMETIHPDIREATAICVGIVAVTLMVSILLTVNSKIKTSAELAGTIAIASLLLFNTNSMILLASDTVEEIVTYGKLLLPVMTTALAAQGGITASTALYAGSALFISVLQSVMGSILVPGIYLYIALRAGSSATGEDMLKKTGDLLKGCLSWILKIILIIFTTYLSITGIVSGTTDAAAVKATKVTVSSFVPVVGGVLSDASEAVLISAGLLKNAAGIYGILAVLAVFLHPFIQIGIHYLILKLTEAVCSVFSSSRITGIISAFSGAMGLLLGMTAASSVMVLISTVCFMKGVS